MTLLKDLSAKEQRDFYKRARNHRWSLLITHYGNDTEIAIIKNDNGSKNIYMMLVRWVV